MSIKSRRLFAVLVITAMLLSLLPLTAFAASDNSIDRVVTVAKGTDLADLDVKTPKLTIKNKNSTFSDEEIFRLQLLSTATWNDGLKDAIKFENGAPDDVDVTVTKITDQTVQIRVYGDKVADENFKIEIPMNVKLKDSASGEQTVTIVPRNSAVTGSSHVFAIVAEGKTIAIVGDKKTITRSASTGASIVLDETVAGALAVGEQEFRMRLPRGFEWCDGTEVDISALDTTPAAVAGLSKFGDRDLIVSFEVTTLSSIPQSIVITPVVRATKDADFGDVTVSISNRSGQVANETGLLIGTYKDYGVDVEIEEVKEFYAGWLDEDYTTAKITLKGAVAGSFLEGRYIEFELPSWVRLTGDIDITVDGVDDKTIEINEQKKVTSFEYEVQDGEKKIEFKLPITIAADAAADGPRDIVLTIEGGGVEETELVIGKAVAPVTVEVGEQKKVFDVGLQKQDAPDITIVEADAAAIRDAEGADVLRVSVPDFFGDSARFDSFDWEVVEGDIDISSAKIVDNGEAIELTVKACSEEASTIRLYNIKMTLDRTVPLGTFRMDVGGSAIVNNNENDAGDKYSGFPPFVSRFDYIEVGTPIDGAAAGEAVFTIGSVSYTLNGEEKEMDVAPYIKSDRTFLPVRYVAYAVGVSEENILWDAVNRTVTIFKGDRIVQLTIDSNVMVVNGVNVNMDVAPEISNGRTMMPIRWVAQALGATITWDPVARTVTVEN